MRRAPLIAVSPPHRGRTDPLLARSFVYVAFRYHEAIDVDKLVVSEAYVNEGPRQKRVRPAPMGRAYRYQRRSSHIVIQLAEKGVKE